MNIKNILLLLLLSILIFTQCTIEQTPYQKTEERRAQISKDTIPIIMIHGALASGDTYATQAQRFSGNDYSDNYLYAFDWNSIAQSSPTAQLDELVNEVLSVTGEEMVNLVGHSAGGGLASEYLSDDDHASKVNKYIHLASFDIGGPAGSTGQIPTLNIYSPADLIVPGVDINGVQNVNLPDLDHYQVATSEASFAEMFRFLHEAEASNTQVIEEESVVLSGRVVTLGENEIKTETLVEIYRIDSETCFSEEFPVATFTTDENGFWGDFNAEKETLYEFVISDSSDPNFRTIHYYREAFVRSDHFVYLRAFPGPGSLAGILLAGIPSGEDEAVVTIFSSSQAIISGRDELSIRDLTLSNNALTSADQSTIAIFCYDDDSSQTTSGNPIPIFSTLPFLNGVDVFLPTTEPKTNKVTFNGRKLYPRNWKAGSEGVSVVVFN